ncbi:MAG: Ribonuclease [bacterium ADurb.Bin429]|nr:MAG: Ribonuclease [bacterium ADurb.Bin429]
MTTPFWTNIRYHGAVYLHSVDLWLDARAPREWAFVSHAHSDHIAAHREVILSAGTARFLAARGAVPHTATVLPFGETRTVRGVECTLYPAGHILGSAQLLAAVGGRSLLYSGDFKLQPNLTAEAITIPRAEVLIMETTFGHRRYAFPPQETVLAEMRAWVEAALADGATPVLMGYSLGKGQEILAALDGCGHEVLLHSSLYEMTRIAEELGATFPPYGRWAPGMGAGSVVLCPPHLRKWMKTKLPPHRAAIVSGWAFDPGARFRYGAAAAFCLSDHADYQDLLTYVERVGPSRVYTVHGHASEFAGDLRRLGYDAHALDEADQLELF